MVGTVIPVCWHAMKEEEGRGRFDCCAQLNDMLDLYPCEHFGAREKMPAVRGAVVVVHGGREIGRIDKLNEDIKKLEWCLLIGLGDEESTWPWEQVEHPNKRIWIQEPQPWRHGFANRFMINGYGHDRQRHIVKVEKDLDWFLGAQITHERRVACVDALRKIPWGGVVIETKGYYQGVSMAEYVRMLCRAKIVPCPSGPFSPDAARPWDCLQAGGIPILDDLSPIRKEPGFWKMVLGEHPLPVIEDWSTLQARLHEIISNGWEEKRFECQVWWTAFKFHFTSWLEVDLWKLTGRECTKI
jgi:hypothetical protein